MIARRAPLAVPVPPNPPGNEEARARTLAFHVRAVAGALGVREWRTLETVSSRTGLVREVVEEAVALLVQRGLAEVDRSRRPNRARAKRRVREVWVGGGP